MEMRGKKIIAAKEATFVLDQILHHNLKHVFWIPPEHFIKIFL